MGFLNKLLRSRPSEATISNTATNDFTVTSREFVPLSFLAHADGVLKSRQRFQKLVFLLDEHLGDRATLYTYKKRDYGPNAPALLKALTSLENAGLIQIDVRYTFGGNARRTYRLLDFGEETVDALLTESDDFAMLHEHTATVFDEYGELPVSNLIKHVRDNHSEYWRNNVYI